MADHTHADDTNRRGRTHMEAIRILRSKRKRRNIEGQQAADVYRVLVEDSAQGMAVIQDGRVVFANAMMAALTGYSQDRLRAMSFDEVQALVHPDEREMVWGQYLNAQKNRPAGGLCELKMIHSDGTIRWLLLCAGRTVYRGRPAVQAAFTDITGRRPTDDGWKDSEAQLKRAQEVAHVGSWYLDLASRRLVWSDETYRIFGVPLGRPLDEDDFLQRVHPDDSSAVRQAWTAALAGALYDIEHRIVVDGTVKWVREKAVLEFDTEGRPRRGVGTVQDVTERREAEDALGFSLRCLEVTSRCDKRTVLLKEFVAEIQKFTDCEAVGIRLLDDEGNIPYRACSGFDRTFYELDNPLSMHLDNCMCVNVIAGRVESDLSYFSEGGSFHLNGATQFWAAIPEEEKGRTRNACSEAGFESMGLVPIQGLDRILGLIHVADRRVDKVPLQKIKTLETIAVELGVALERIDAEEALRASEERYRLLFHEMLSGVALHEIICDDNGRPYDYRFLSVNPAFEELTGLRVRDVIGKTVREVTPQIESSWIERYGRVALTGEPIHFEDYFRALGKYFEVRAHCPRQGQFAVTFHDITARRRAENALRESEQTARALLNAPGMLALLTDCDGTVVGLNRTLAESLGACEDELLGRSIEHCFPPALAEARKAGLCEVLRSSQVLYCEEECEGDWSDTVIYPIQDADGRIRRVAFLTTNVTERKRLEQQAKDQQAELLHAARLTTLGEMASGLAHELNQPLSAIQNYGAACIRLASVDRPDMPRIRRNLARITGQAERARGIMGRVRGFAQRRLPRLTAVNLNQIVRNILDLLTWELRQKRIALCLDLDDQLPVVWADSIQIEQVVLNLTRNAIEAMDEGQCPSRRLTIRTCRTDDDAVQLEVSDTGMGLPLDNIEKIFDAFFTTKAGGLGIGLSISRTIMEVHSGTLRAQRNTEGGSTFVAVLPAGALDRLRKRL